MLCEQSPVPGNGHSSCQLEDVMEDSGIGKRWTREIGGRNKGHSSMETERVTETELLGCFKYLPNSFLEESSVSSVRATSCSAAKA